jgi:hypothetical protein
VATNPILPFYPLTFVPEGEDIVVGRSDINSFAIFPADGVALLKQMQAGMSPQAASQWYQEQYHEPIDIEDFIGTLRDMQFIRGEEDVSPDVSARARLINWQFVGKALFSPVAWVIYGLLFGYCLYLMKQFPSLRPMNSHLFFSRYYTVIELGLFFGQFPCILFHELFHVLAGKRLGLSSRLGISRRLYFVVFETDLSGLWSVPKRARYLPFLAGMLGDCVLFSLLTILASFSFTAPNSYTLLGAFYLALAYTTVLRFIWQFYFYLKTDIYYVLTAMTGCVDLQRTTRQYIWNCLYRLLGKTGRIVDEADWHPRDRKIVPYYAPFYMVGYLISIGVLIIVAIPVAYYYLSGILTRLLTSKALNIGFWDVCVFLALNLLQLIVFVTLLWREHNRKRRVVQVGEG